MPSIPSAKAFGTTFLMICKAPLTSALIKEPEAVQLLSFWCRTPQQMRRFIGIILNAKYRVEKDHKDIGVIIPLDDDGLKPLITKALRRYFNTLRSTSRMLRITYTAPCKTYLAFGGINKRLENMRPNTPKNRTLTVGVRGIKRHISSFKPFQVLHVIILKSLRSKNRHLEWLNWR